jgi:thiamine biosynthesis lipoprotein
MQEVRYQFKAMGSPCELLLYSHVKNHQRITDLVTQEVFRLEQKYSRYRGDSVTHAINSTAQYSSERQRRITVDEETANLLDYAAVAYNQSDGLFDITSGVYRRVWDFKSNAVPTEFELTKIRQNVGWDKILWQRPKLAFPVKGMEIDFGGYVKEYAADLVASILKQQGIEHGYIDLGGDISVVGPHPDGSPWRIGIRNPRSPDTPIATIDVMHGAIASSGDYERYMIVNGERYCHIINPKTGWPVKHWAGVSVFSDMCLLAGTSSTITMLKESSGKEWLAETGMASILLDSSGNRFINNGNEEHVYRITFPTARSCSDSQELL